MMECGDTASKVKIREKCAVQGASTTKHKTAWGFPDEKGEWVESWRGKLGVLERESEQSKIRRMDVGGSRPNPFLIGGPAFEPLSLRGGSFNKQTDFTQQSNRGNFFQ
jgi:hypothetical protein